MELITQSKLRIAAGCVLILLASFVTWQGTVKNEFLYDDDTFVVLNPSIRALTPVTKFFDPDTSSHNPQMNRDVWRPLTTLSYALNYAASGLNSAAFHAVNMFLHGINAVLVFLVLLMVLRRRRSAVGESSDEVADILVAGLSALVFAVHPVQAETVAWVSQRSNILYFFFYLLSFAAFLRAREISSTPWTGVSVVLFCAALLSKEMAISLPALLFAYLWAIEKKGLKGSFIAILPHAAAAALFVVCRSLMLGQTAQTVYWAGGLVPQMLTMVKGFAWYVKLALAPWPLSVEYLFAVKHTIDAEVIIYGMMLAALGGIALRLRKREPLISFGILMFFISLLPVSNIVPIRTIINERFLYAALIGFGVICASMAVKFARTRGRAGVVGVAAACAVVLAGYAGMSARRIQDWKNHWSFVTSNLQTCPQSATLHFGMGRAYAARGDFDKAIDEYELCLKIDPQYAEAFNDIGRIAAKKGDTDAAIEHYRRSVQKKVDYFEGLTNLGVAYYRKGDYAQAVKILERACALRPDDGEARTDLAAARAYAGDLPGAIALSGDILQRHPGLHKARYNLAVFYRSAGMAREAQAQVDALLALDPGHGPALRLRDEMHSAPAASAAQPDIERIKREFSFDEDIRRKFADAERSSIAEQGECFVPEAGYLGSSQPLSTLKPEEKAAIEAVARRRGADVPSHERMPQFRIAKQFSDGYRVSIGALSWSVKPLGARNEEAVCKDGVVLFPGAYPGVDMLYLYYGDSLEQMYALRDRLSENGIVRLSQHIEGVRVARGPHDEIVVVDRDDPQHSVMELTRPLVIDSRGRRREGAYELRDEGDKQLLTIVFNDTGLDYPLLIDPLWKTTAGPMTYIRDSHCVTLLPNGKVLVTGGTGRSSAELYDTATGSFTVTGSMSSIRTNHTSTLLPSGKVLIAGGMIDSTQIFSTAELYDPQTGIFTPTASMSDARVIHSATLLNNGKVLIAGGYNGTSGLSSAELYDPDTETFSLTGSMTTGRRYHCAVPLPSGKVLMVGGNLPGSIFLSVCDIYDPSTGQFTSTGSLLSSRALHTANLLPNGKVLVAGGFNGSAFLSTAELYSPAAGTWAATGNLGAVRGYHSSALLPNGKVLVAGGTVDGAASLSTTLIYDPAAATFSSAGAMSTGRLMPEMVAMPSGRVLIVAGWDGVTQLASADVYDPQTSNSSATGSMKSLRDMFTATLLPNGKVLVAGGSTNGTDTLSTAELYDPATALFTYTGSMTTTRRSHSATLLSTGKVLIAGGWDGSTDFSTAELYDPDAGTFSTTGSMNTARDTHGSVLLSNGKVLVFGGFSGAPVVSTAELYDPSSGLFTPTGSMTTLRAYAGAALLFNGKVLIPGGHNGSATLSTAEIYNPDTGQFTATGSLSTQRNSYGIALLPSGKVLVSGGYATGALSTCDLYDPDSGTFSTTGAMNTVRQRHHANLLPNGKVMISGGFAASSSISAVQVYDPEKVAFSTAPAMTIGRVNHAAVQLPNGKILIAGGDDGQASVTEFSSAELVRYTEYDYTLVASTMQPSITSLNGSSSFPATLGRDVTYTLAGVRFLGYGEASGGNYSFQCAANEPRVTLQRLDCGSFGAQSDAGMLIDVTPSLYPMTKAQWQSVNTSLSFKTPANLPEGYYLLRVISHGIPSDAKIVRCVANTFPSVPASLAQRRSDTGAEISWGGATNNTTPRCTFTLSDPDAANTVRFRIQISTTADYSATSVDYTGTLLAQGATGFTCTILGENTYYWRVCTIDEIGAASPWVKANGGAMAFAVTADMAAPAGISNLTALAFGTEGRIRLSWTAPGDNDLNGTVTGYLLHYATAPVRNQDLHEAWVSTFTGTAFWSGFVPGSSAESQDVFGLAGDTTYYFALQAYDDAGNFGIWHSSAEVSTVNTAATAYLSAYAGVAPAAVSDFSAAVSSVSGAVDLYWSSPGDDGMAGTLDAGSEYCVQYSTWPLAQQVVWSSAAAQVAVSAVGRAPSSAVTYRLGQLAYETTYYFRMWTHDDAGLYSGISNGATAQVYLQPAAVTDLSAAGTTSLGTLLLNWTAPSENEGPGGAAGSYDIRMATAAFTADEWDEDWVYALANEPAPLTPGATQSMTVVNLRDGVRYYFRMRTADRFGYVSAVSDPVTSAQTTLNPSSRIYDTSGGTTYARLYSNSPDVAGPVGGTEAIAAAYIGAASDDSGYFATTGVANNTIVVETVLFKISESTSVITSVSPYWKGYCINSISAGLAPTFFIWNFNIGQWVGISTGTAITTDQISSTTYTTNINYYIQESSCYFKVRAPASSSRTSSVRTNLIKVTLGLNYADTIAPGAITDLSGAMGADPYQIDLSWTAPGNDGGNGNVGPTGYYTVKYATYAVVGSTDTWWNGGQGQIGTYTQNWPVLAAHTRESHVLTMPDDNLRYWIAVKTTDESGNTSALSGVLSPVNAVSQTANIAPTLPSVLTQLAGSGYAGLAWNGWTNQTAMRLKFDLNDPDAGDMLRYHIQVSTKEGDFSASYLVDEATNPVNGWLSAGTTWYDLTLTQNTSYWWRVRGIDDELYTSSFALGTVSAGQKHFGVDTVAPGPPTLSGPLNALTTGQTTISFSWSAATDTLSGVYGYTVRASTDPGLTGSVLWNESTGRAQTLTLDGGTWYWCVRSSDAAGNYSAWSSTWSVSIDTVAPSIVTGFIAASGVQLNLSWVAPGENEYAGNVTGGAVDIRYSSRTASSPADAEYAVTISSNWTQGAAQGRVLTGLLPRATYYAWVRTRDNMGNWSVWSATKSAIAGSFIDTKITLTNLNLSSLSWGDYDNDGDLDLVICGWTGSGSTSYTRIYRNNGNGTFTDIVAGLPGVEMGALAWGDYDNDGDLDLAITGYTGSTDISRIYRNNGNNSFTDISAGLPGLYESAVAWGDYDNDGDLDLALSGYGSTGAVTRIYRNDGGVFADISAGLIPCSGGNDGGFMSWGDYDNDGDLDLVVCGWMNSTQQSILYRNDNGKFTDAAAGFTGMDYGAVAWGDYDNDGDLDLAMVGETSSSRAFKIYRNNGNGTFTNTANLTAMEEASLSWGDYDNDGDLDLLVCGYTGSVNYTKIFRNNGGVFNDSGIVFQPMRMGSISFGDYDGDGDLDFAETGYNLGYRYARIYKSLEADFGNANTSPAAPAGGLDGSYDTGTMKVTLAWDAGSDAQTTQANGMYYEVRIATNAGLSNTTRPWIVSTSSGAGTGSMPAQNLGSYPHGFISASQPGMVLKPPLGDTTYYWQVRSVDTALSKSAWSAESSVYVSSMPAAPGKVNYLTAQTGMMATLSWMAPGDDAYTGNVSGGLWRIRYSSAAEATAETAAYTIERSSSWAQGITYTEGITGLLRATTYYFWIQARDANDNWSVWSDSATCVSGWFDETRAGIGPLSIGALAWGDYDNDGNLDLVIQGWNPSTEINATKLYHNNGDGSFEEVNAGLPGLETGWVSWGDYDNDGDLDLALCGWGNSSAALSSIYRNDGGGTFTDIGAGLPGVYYSSLNWGDYDNDGDLDLVLSGAVSTSTFITNIYRNNAGSFTVVNAGLNGVDYSAVAWGDYDNDGDLDLAVCGYSLAQSQRVSLLYRNNGDGSFTDITAGFTGLNGASIAWGDYDNDGYLDIAMCGYNGTAFNTLVYHNNGNGTFTNSGASLTGVTDSSMSWGDIDNDGDLDLVVSGYVSGSQRIARIYINNSGSFAELNAGIVGMSNGGVSLGDYDNDGDLDIAVSGQTAASEYLVRIARNLETEYGNANAAPLSPSAGLAGSYSSVSKAVTLAWDRPSDDETADARGLYYEVRVATQAVTGAVDRWVVPAPAGAGTGFGETQRIGTYPHGYVNSASTLPGVLISSPPVRGTTYYWQARTIDGGAKKSAWSAEQSLYVPSLQPGQVTGLTASATTQNSVALVWVAPGDDEYWGDVTGGAWEIKYSSAVNATVDAAEYAVGISTDWAQGAEHTRLITGFADKATWYFWIRAQDDTGNWSVWSATCGVMVDTLAPAQPGGTAASSDGSTVTLSWIAPGEDGATGDVTGGMWEIRYSSSTGASSSTAEFTIQISSDWVQGAALNRIVTGLRSAVTWYFWLRGRDSAGNWSIWSDTAAVWNHYFLSEIVDDDANDIGNNTSITVSAAGAIDVTHAQTWPTYALKHAHRYSGSWFNEVIDAVGNVGEYSSFAEAVNGDKYVSYREVDTDKKLKFARWNGIVWSTSTIDIAGGKYSSIAVDGPGRVHVAYADTDNWNLKYGVWDGIAWSTATVYSDGDSGNWASIVLDGAGRAHIAFYKDSPDGDLMYATNASGSWVVNPVETTGDVGKYCSLALDGDGRPHIAYYDVSNANLCYTAWNGIAWSSATIDTAGDVGQWCGLALDGAGNAHISYWDATNNDLKYAFFNGSSWTIVTVDEDGGKYSSIVLDAGGYPYISYYGYENNCLKVARWIQAPYLSTLGGNTRGKAQAPSAMKATAQGTGNIDWQWNDNASGEFGYRVYVSSAGNSFVMAAGTQTVSANQSTYSQNGLTPNTSYWAYAAAVNAGGIVTSSGTLAWTLAAVPDALSVIGQSSWTVTLGWGDGGNPSYTRWGVVRSSDNFVTSTVTVKGFSDAWVSRTLTDTQGLIMDSTYWYKVRAYDEQGLASAYTMSVSTYVAYQEPPGKVTGLDAAMSGLRMQMSWTAPGDDAYSGDVSNGIWQVRYSTHVTSADGADYELNISSDWVQGSGQNILVNDLINGATYSAWVRARDGSGVWSVWSDTFSVTVNALTLPESVDNGNEIGNYTSLAMGLGGQAHIMHAQTWPTYALKHARWNGSAWNNETVDAGGDLGEYSSVAVGVNGDLHVSYRELEPNKQLKYAHWDGVAWSTATIDRAGGKYNSIALDGAGRVHVAYTNTDSWDLKYGVWDGVSWSTATVYTGADSGNWASLALESDGKAHVAFYEDEPDGDLMYATNRSGSWVVTPVETSGIVGKYSSIAVDGDGHPHIAYYDVGNGDLCYASWNGVAWSTATIDSGGNVGEWVSIALDGLGWPHISYFDTTNSAGKYARWNGSSWERITYAYDNAKWGSIAIDATGCPWISHYAGASNALKVSRWMLPCFIAPVNGNSRSTVEAPDNLRPGSITNNTIGWLWNDNSFSEFGYRVYASTAGAPFVLLAGTSTVGAGQTSYVQGMLTPNTSSWAYVAVINPGGVAVSSSAVAWTLANAPGATAVTSLNANQITVSWTAGSNPAYTRWGVVRSTDNFSASTTTLAGFGSQWLSTAWSDTGLNQETTYWYKVCAFNEAGRATAYDTAVSTYIPDITMPGIVTGFGSVTGFAPGTIALQWVSPGDDGYENTLTGGKYRVRYATYTAGGAFWNDSAANWADPVSKFQVDIATTSSPGQAASRLITGLAEGVTYYFRVWARDEMAGTADWDGNWSAISQGTTYWAQVAIIDIRVEPKPNIDFGSIAAGTSKVVASTFTVRNLGNVSVRYQLKLTGVPAAWGVKETSGPTGYEQVKVLALFTTMSPPAVGDFTDDAPAANGGDVVQSSAFEVATSSAYAIAADPTSVKGYQCVPGSERVLWFRFDAPSATDQLNQQFVTVSVTGLRE